MLQAISLDVQADSPEDFEYFKTLFLRNVGTEQMMFNFYLDNVMVRLQISGVGGSQLIGVGFFHYHKVENSTTIEQFNPLKDMRFQNLEPITRLWGLEPNTVWGHFRHLDDEVQDALERIIEILNIVNRVNKLKAFL